MWIVSQSHVTIFNSVMLLLQEKEQTKRIKKSTSRLSVKTTQYPIFRQVTFTEQRDCVGMKTSAYEVTVKDHSCCDSNHLESDTKQNEQLPSNQDFFFGSL